MIRKFLAGRATHTRVLSRHQIRICHSGKYLRIRFICFVCLWGQWSDGRSLQNGPLALRMWVQATRNDKNVKTIEIPNCLLTRCFEDFVTWRQPMITALTWSWSERHELFAFLITSTVVHLKFLGQSAAPSGHGVATTHDTTPLGTDPECTTDHFGSQADTLFWIFTTVPIYFLQSIQLLKSWCFANTLRFCQYQNRRYAGLPLPTTCGSAAGEGAELENILKQTGCSCLWFGSNV